MRIVGGSARSRVLRAPGGMDTRPTLDQVRETIFNVLQRDVPGAQVLDLYAGSGAMALEAISRGAKKAVLVDVSRDALKVIGENIHVLKFEDKCRVMGMPAEKALESLSGTGARFDLVFLDPPYKMRVEENCEMLRRARLIDQNSVLVVEHSVKTPPDISEHYERVRYKTFGDTAVGFYLLLSEEDGK